MHEKEKIYDGKQRKEEAFILTRYYYEKLVVPND